MDSPPHRFHFVPWSCSLLHKIKVLIMLLKCWFPSIPFLCQPTAIYIPGYPSVPFQVSLLSLNFLFFFYKIMKKGWAFLHFIENTKPEAVLKFLHFLMINLDPLFNLQNLSFGFNLDLCCISSFLFVCFIFVHLEWKEVYPGFKTGQRNLFIALYSPPDYQ